MAGLVSAVGQAQDACRPPAVWWRWRFDGHDLGWLAPAHQRLLADWGLGESMPDAQVRTWACLSGTSDPAARTAWLADLADRLRDAGWVSGWRDERYCCRLSLPQTRPQTRPQTLHQTLHQTLPSSVDGPADGPPFFELERAAYRFFGLSSQAVHVNGVDASGALWCGRRALHKATDPGRLDNLAAGGLASGEELFVCARRELWEEAGVPAALCGSLRLMGRLRGCRVEPQGWHDEWLHVFELPLPAGFVPSNQDGEVSAFECLDPHALAQRIADGDFSPDAALVCAWWLRQADRG